MSEDKKRIVDELHKPARRNYPRRKVDIRGLDETWQADLVVMETLKRKTAAAITTAFKSILAKGRKPKNLHVDQGTEFDNKECKELLKKYKIKLYSTFSGPKAAIIE